MNEYDSPSTRFSWDHVPQPREEGGLPNTQILGSREQAKSKTRKENVSYSYFDLRHKGAPSPTSTLVADLSQNFHLGASYGSSNTQRHETDSIRPAVPTPRRSLMAQFSCHDNDYDRSPSAELDPTTPYDELRSSPGDVMDTSPLPFAARRVISRSTSMFEASQQTQPRLSSLGDGFSAIQRPSLISRKAISSFAHPTIQERKPLRLSSFHDDKENDLASQFEDSPKKFRGSLLSIVGSGQSAVNSLSYDQTDLTRSPLTPISCNSISKKRLPGFRRTQSMITKNDDFLAPELNLSPTMNHQPSPVSPEQLSTSCQILPSFSSKDDQLKRITGFTFAQVLDGHYQHRYDKLEVIDCRFPHEYEGGHIPCATNVSSLDAMDKHPLLTDPQPHRSLIVLHCEYSAHRAPRIALHLRNRDRMLNVHRYPMLHYPEIYILDGGYSRFYREYRHHVGDSGYVEMNDPQHKPLASKQMHSFRKNTKFQRTQSYTFGQGSPLMGGASMEREIRPPFVRSGSAQNPLNNHFSFGQRPSPPRKIEADSNEMGDIDSRDCSMMDLDDSFEDRSAERAAETSQNVFERSHHRSSSGRIDPRRLSSF